jgi:hypothetical protein
MYFLEKGGEKDRQSRTGLPEAVTVTRSLRVVRAVHS